MGDVFASYSSDKGLKNLNSQRINNLMKKWAHELKRHFSKEEVQMAKNYMKKYTTSLTIKEIQVKPTLRCHLTLLKWISSRTETTNVGKDVMKQELVGGDVK
jgi:hypothetical protein